MRTKESFPVLFSLFFSLFCIFTVIVLANLDVTLLNPVDGNVSGIANVTLTCSINSTNPIAYTELYHDIDGNFTSSDSYYFKGIASDPGNVLLFHLNNDSFAGENGTFVYDWSGNNNNGNVSTASYDESGGKWFGSYDFTGSSSEYILVDDSDSLDITTNGTIEFWFKLNNKNQQTFLTKGEENDDIYNSYAIHFNLMALERLWIYLAPGYELQTINANVGTLNTGQWYHFTVTWNGSRVITYLNGVEKNDVAQSYVPYNNIYDLKIGNGPYGSLNGNIDDLAIYNRTLSETEIFNHYNQNYTAQNDTNVSFNLTNVSDGSYMWNCLAYDNETTNWSGVNYTFHVDVSTPPTINSIDLSPSSEDDVDPGVNVSVTVNATDASNVSSVMLQYKAPLASLYTNDTMDYNSGTGLWENGTIVTNPSGDEGVWNYKVWTNDTNGHSTYSDTYNLSVEFDATWTLTIINSSGNVSEILDVVSGFKGSEKNLGIIIVNNTGESTLSFDLDSTSSTVLVSYNQTEPFDLSPGNEKHMEVNATLPETPNEYTFRINVTSSGGTPKYREVNASVISFIGGPYINETTEITDYPSSITQGYSANFTGYVKNIGNETAYYVWLNWTFPSGWSIAYGNATNMIGNLSPQESYSLTITTTASSSLTAGGSMVWLNTSSNGTAGADSKIVIINCNSNDGVCGAGCTYASDDDCTVPSGGRSGGDIVGTFAVIEPRMETYIPGRVDLTTGGVYYITVNVTNPVERTNLTEVKITFDGYPMTLIERIPFAIPYINPEETESFLIEITVPSYIEEKDYFVTVTVKAKGVYGGVTKNIESTEKTIFAVHGIEENETLVMIGSAESAIETMKDANLIFAVLADMLEDARQAYANLDFDRAAKLAGEVVSLKETAFSVLSSIENIGIDIEYAENYGLSVEEAKTMHELAKSAFQRGDYKRAEARMTAAITAFQLETKNLLPLIVFLQGYWPHVLVVIVLLTVSSFFVKKRVRIRALGEKLEKVRDKRVAVKELVKDLQNEYYNRREISKGDYLFRKNGYDKRLAGLISEELRLERRLDMMTGNRKDALLRGRSSIEKGLMDMQHNYFELGRMGKSEYEESVKELQSEMAEIEKEMKKASEPKKSKGMFGLMVMLAVLIVFSDSMVAHALENVTSDDVTVAISEAENVIEDMVALGFGTERVNNTLENAKLMLSSGEYETALATAKYVPVLKQKAILADGLLDDVELMLLQFSSQGYDTTLPQEMFDEALADFESEDYDSAESMLSQAMDLMDDMEREAILARATEGNIFTSFTRWVNENILISAFVLLATLLVVILAVVTRRRTKMERKVEGLETSIEDTKKSIKDVQHDYFNKRTLSRRNYETKMGKHRNGLERLMEELETAVHKHEKRISSATEKPKVRKKPEKEHPKPTYAEPVKPKPEKAKEVVRKEEVAKPKTPAPKRKKVEKAMVKLKIPKPKKVKKVAERIRTEPKDVKKDVVRKPMVKPEMPKPKKAEPLPAVGVKPELGKPKKAEPLPAKPEIKKIGDLLGKLKDMLGQDVAVLGDMDFFKMIKIANTAVYWYKATDKTGELLISSGKKVSDGKYTIFGELKEGRGRVPYIKLKNVVNA